MKDTMKAVVKSFSSREAPWCTTVGFVCKAGLSGLKNSTGTILGRERDCHFYQYARGRGIG